MHSQTAQPDQGNRDFEHGTDNSPEKLSGGLTHVFLVTSNRKQTVQLFASSSAHGIR